MAAPAFAASIADSAISLGVTGTLADLLVVSPAPVTAQVMKTSQFIRQPPSPCPTIYCESVPARDTNSDYDRTKTADPIRGERRPRAAHCHSRPAILFEPEVCRAHGAA